MSMCVCVCVCGGPAPGVGWGEWSVGGGGVKGEIQHVPDFK